MEKAYVIASYISPTIEILLMGYCFYRFSKPFMKQKRGAVLSGAAYCLLMLYFLYFRPWRLGYFAMYGIVFLAVFFVMCQMDKRIYRQKAFLVVTFFSLHCFTSGMAEILYDNLYSFAERSAYMARHANQWFALFIGVCIVYLASEVLFMVIGITCVLKVYAYKYNDMEPRELFMLAVPSCIGVAGYAIMQYYRSFYIQKIGMAQKSYDLLSFLYYAVSVILVVVVIVQYQSIRTKQEEKLQNELFAAQIDSVRQHIEQVESLYQNIRSIRHDMTNHLITLERLYETNELEEAKTYGTELKRALAKVTGEINSGNPVTDVILQEFKEEAKRRGIHFELEFTYPYGSAVNAFDISVILHNALQNAIEHTKDSGNPLISVVSYCRNNAYMLEICNRFSGELQWNMERDLPMTTKKASGHGYGLLNIQKAAEKYAGGIDVTVKDGMFCLSILLMLES